MKKKLSVVSLVVSGAMIFSLAGSGCKKAEQPAEAPKPAEQPQPSQAPGLAVEQFKATNGMLEKGGIGYVLSSSAPDKMAKALKKIDTQFKNMVTVKGRLKAVSPSGIRNGYIIFGGKESVLSKTGLLIGGKKLEISGPFVGKAEKKENFDQNKVFDFELTINLKEKTVVWKVDGLELKSKITKVPASINYIGYAVWQTKTEFSDLEITGN